jgi:hypothetical protein
MHQRLSLSPSAPKKATHDNQGKVAQGESKMKRQLNKVAGVIVGSLLIITGVSIAQIGTASGGTGTGGSATAAPTAPT